MKPVFLKPLFTSLPICLVCACTAAEPTLITSTPITIPTSVTQPAATLNGTTPLRQIDSYFIDGETTAPVRRFALTDLLPVPSIAVNYGELAPAGQQPKLMAFGDGLAAGWRDGGLYREGQLTAFPNLVAHQMRLAEFASPLFAEAQGNGTGYVVLSRQTPGPRWKTVMNDRGIVKEGDLPEFMPYLGKTLHNWAVPKLTRAGMSAPYLFDPSSMNPETGKNYSYSSPYLLRMLPDIDRSNDTYFDLMLGRLNKNTCDIALFTFEYDYWFYELLKHASYQIGLRESHTSSAPLATLMANKATNAGVKSVVYTIPHFKDLAFFTIYKASAIEKSLPYISYSYGNGNKTASTEAIFLPNKTTAKLFDDARTGNIVSARLSELDVIDGIVLEMSSPAMYNSRIRKDAEFTKAVVVDLEMLYARIAAGTYITDDGLKIDGSITGNFFSSDGIYPSLIGHSVIANETIKAINKAYKSEIPLIKVSLLTGK
ncbi:hypothetical protein [uncultured Fibrella sp.]|uniref:hypothetical protein n=1 Tax=uncultured Fibrella sp. TaxID=1284596 RepID=UPI0035CB486F